MLTAREAFKAGFLARCAEDGLGPGQAHTLVKAALGLTDLPDMAGKAGLALAGTAPLMLGGGLGYLAAKATDADDTDATDLKRRELIDEYVRQAAHLRSMTSLRHQSAAAPARTRRAY